MRQKNKMQISYKQEVLRKLIHLSSLWMVAIQFYFQKPIVLVLFGILLLLTIFVEYGHYKNWPLFSLYGKIFKKMLRAKETDGKFRLSGGPYVLMGAFLSVLFFNMPISALSLAVMLIGDTAAALIGRKWGKHKINNDTKSLEGAFAFFISGLFVLALFSVYFSLDTRFFILATVGILFATLAEVYEKQIKIDDNIAPVLCIGFVLSLVG